LLEQALDTKYLDRIVTGEKTCMRRGLVDNDYWEDPERVNRFAERDPDHRLVALVGEYPHPTAIRILDVGCAGGRNTVFLARLGFDLVALDASAAMVERTRARLAEVMGKDEAERRVQQGRMDDLACWPDGVFHLVVSLGVHHNARTMEEWERTAAETARVLRRGGRLLLNQFTPEVDLTGEGVTPVPGEPHVFVGFPGGRVVLMDAPTLDEHWAGHRMTPAVPSETVRVERDQGRRVSVNALYEKG
jgi:SAM-dependent methyltransferase